MNYRIIHKETTVSTNDDVKLLFSSDEPEGLVIVAEHQTAGRGRNGAWSDDAQGMLLMSLLLRPSCALSDYLQLNYWAGQAVIAAVNSLSDEIFDTDLRIKWPNDVLMNHKKICGVLQEGQLEGDRLTAVALGIGVNVNTSRAFLDSQGLQEASSLLIETGHPWDKKILLESILQEFAKLYRV